MKNLSFRNEERTQCFSQTRLTLNKRSQRVSKDFCPMNTLKAKKSRKVRLSRKRMTLNSASTRSIVKSTQSRILEFRRYFRTLRLKRSEFLDMRNMIRIMSLLIKMMLMREFTSLLKRKTQS